MEPIDYYRTARILIKEYGDQAADEADRRMQQFIDKDDAKAAAVWLAVGQAISDLLATKGTKHWAILGSAINQITS